MQGTMNIIGAGGAGIAIVSQVSEKLSALGSGFSKIKVSYIDTSKNNIATVKGGESRFFKIETKSHAKEEIVGSGGERKAHASDILIGVNEYLDQMGIKEAVTGEYYFVVFSASGGTGNMVGAFLIRSLLEMGIPVVAVIAGDSTCGLYAANTLDTIATLHNIVIKNSQTLSVMYINNEAYMGNGHANAIKEANLSIFNSLSAMSLFLSGDNLDIDAQDMRNFIDQNNYSKINIPAGLYAINSFSKEVVIPDGCKATVSRTLTTSTISPDLNIENLQHSKVGRILDENALKIYNEYAPIHLISYANFFTKETARLKTYSTSMLNDLNNIEIDSIQGSDNSQLDDDTGIIF